MILNDKQIKNLAVGKEKMIDPFSDKSVAEESFIG